MPGRSTVASTSSISRRERRCHRPRRRRSRRSKMTGDTPAPTESAMRPIVLFALVTVLAGGCASVPPDQDPVQIRLNDLDGRVSKVERVVSNQSLLQMAQQVDTLQAEVRDLRGQIDDLQNSNRELRKQQHDMYADLDKRVGALEHGNSGSGSASGEGGGGASSTEQSIYGQAFDALKAGNYTVAISGFQ